MAPGAPLTAVPKAGSPPAHGSPGAAGSPPGQRDSDTHILDRLAVLYRYRHVVVGVFILTVLGVVIRGYAKTPVYLAQARILIEDERTTALPGLTSPENTFFEDPEPYYQTQYKILKGRELTRRVVRKLNLGEIPEFNGTAQPPSLTRALMGAVNRVIGRNVETTQAAAPATPPEESSLIGAFIGHVDVQPVRGSRLVDVSFQAIDREFSARAVNTLVEEYVDQNLQMKLESSQNMLEWLSKELEGQQKKVEDSERALAEYRDKQNALSLDEKQNIVLARLNQLNDAVMKAKTVRVQKEALYNQIKSMAPGSAADSVPVIAQNTQIMALKNRLSDLQRDRARLSERYGPRHPEIVKANAAVEDTQHQIEVETAKALQAVRNEYETAMLEEQTLSRGLEGAKGDAVDLNRKSISYGVMEREAHSNRQIYESLLQREKEMRVSSNSRSNNVRVVDRAEVPTSPRSGDGRRTWLIAIAMGLVISVASAMTLDYLNDTIKTPEDVTQRLKLPFLGLIPSVRGRSQPLLASAHAPHDFGEALRAVRTSLMMTFPDEGTKLIVVTSAQPLEGKTTTACNMALALACSGARVLIIDADMRRPAVHRALRLSNDRGLSQILAGHARARDVLQRTIDPNLMAITAGVPPSNPSELLGSERMKALLSTLLPGPFDWIIIDTPPVLAATDAVVLAPAVSGVVFVIGAEMTRRRLSQRAVQTVLAGRPRQMSAILNKVDFARNKYYYSRYYGHEYKSYYAQAAS